MKKIFFLWVTVTAFMACLLSADAQAYQSEVTLSDSGIPETREPSLGVLDPPIPTPSFDRHAFELNRVAYSSNDRISSAAPRAPYIEPWAKKNFFTIMIGADYWDNLHDIKPGPAVSSPEKFGQFEAWGFNFEFSYHRYVTQLLGNELRVGIDFGLFFNRSEKHFDVIILPSGRRINADLNSRGLYLTPSVRWLIGQRGFTRFYLGAGVGYYFVDFVEQLSDGMVVDKYFDQGTIGGYLSAGLNIPLVRYNPDRLALCLEGKVHFVNFGNLGDFAPGAGDLTGPIYMLQLGLSF